MENGKSTTTWAGVADQVLNTWTQVGTQMWKGWFDALGSVTPTATDIKSTVEPLVQRIANNQELGTRLLQISFNAWQNLLPKVEAGQSWQDSFNQYTEQLRNQLNEFSESSTKMTQDTVELWQLYLKETQKFNQLWLNSFTASFLPLSQTTSGGSAPWIELNNLYWNLLYEQSFGSLMQSPLLGPAREFNGKLLRAFDAWVDLYRASIDYQVVMTDVQVRALEELMRQLITKAEKGETIKDWKQFQQLWGVVADDVFEKAFCDEANLKVRGRFINALNTYRLHQQALMELWMQAVNIPTRTELDEVHKNFYELRKEVKALKKKLDAYESQAAQSTTTPTAATTETAANVADLSTSSASLETEQPSPPESPVTAPEAKLTKRSPRSKTTDQASS
ncbi:MAG TPA: class III poly(R)-hydroxyalkanoic acid synthase subunit PhaE [Synechococcales cyanobacterium M55_K2018_004]|nr:class III poly(R)-hydroxyalkanoic acid synthase subunit PhaE [Synechococcales cyanobacterium M55_K2018_004]